MSLISGVSYYPAGLFSKKSELAAKSGSNKRRDLLTGELLTEVYCTTNFAAGYDGISVLFEQLQVTTQN